MNDPRQPAHPPTAQPVAHPPHPPHAHPAPAARPLTAAPAARPIGAPGVAAPVARPIAAPAHAPAHPPGQIPGQAPQGLPRQAAGSVINPAAHAPRPAEEEPVALVDDDEGDDLAPAPVSTMSKIRQLSGASGVQKHAWKREPKAIGNAPVRVKTFHAKLSDQGLEYLDEAINVFIDEHPEVDVKFVTSNIGMFDGKFKDLALIVNVWY
jgi:hypothetical protein